MLHPGWGPPLSLPQTRPFTAADCLSHLSSWSLKAQGEPEDGTGNITTGNPLTGGITSPLLLASSSRAANCRIPRYQNTAGSGEVLFLPFPGSQRTCLPDTRAQHRLPRSLSPQPKSFPFSELPPDFQSPTQSTNSLRPTFKDFRLSSWWVFKTLAERPAP